MIHNLADKYERAATSLSEMCYEEYRTATSGGEDFAVCRADV
jgi:hypothetical protein